MATGLIYKITNTVNGKCYIGQTRQNINRRWSQHRHNASKRKMGCIMLENAIRKYGEEKFTIEPILTCDVSDLDSEEIRLIDEYKSTVSGSGYNIFKGGGGSSRIVTDEHRHKIAEANRKSDINEINIQERKVNDILVGYVVSRNINTVRHTKNFANTKNSLTQNLELAKSWLIDLNDGKTADTNRYNRIIKLPKNISYNYTNSKKIQGYNVKIERNRRRFIKSFTLKNLSMDEKLNMAIAYKKQILESLRKNEEVPPGNGDKIIRSQALKVE
jgi:group I intron endonuclease